MAYLLLHLVFMPENHKGAIVSPTLRRIFTDGLPVSSRRVACHPRLMPAIAETWAEAGSGGGTRLITFMPKIDNTANPFNLPFLFSPEMLVGEQLHPGDWPAANAETIGYVKDWLCAERQHYGYDPASDVHMLVGLLLPKHQHTVRVYHEVTRHLIP